jgi:AcrR family transcriptional regulator
MSRLKRKAPDSYHHGDLRKALVDAALRALDRQRAEDLSLRALGRELRVSPRAPYRHFETKQQLLAAVAVEGFRLYREHLNVRLAAAGSNPLAQLRAVAETYVSFAVERPAAFRVMYAPYATVQESAPELLQARAEAHRESQAIIAQGQAAGVLREGDPMHLALVLWTSMHGLAVLFTEGQLGRFDRPLDAAKLAGLVNSWIFRGIAREPPSTTP